MTSYMHHVTLTTGHSVPQRREDVAADAVAAIADMLDGILQGAMVPLPVPGYRASGTHLGRDLCVTLWGGDVSQPAPLLTTGVALRSRSAPRLWRMLHDTATGVPIITDRESPPPVPWIADRIEIGAGLHLDAFEWTGDWSRSLAWAWESYSRAR